ncbi:hypothetical protein D3C75_756250 [compost metagenome]
MVEDVICVIERNPEGREKLAAVGLRLHALFSMEELIAAGTGGHLAEDARKA